MIASTSSKRGRRAARVAAADDLARDAVGVALLAVLAQQRARGGGASQVLTTSRAVSACVGVHAHVERRVVGVGEAALARVDLHRGHAEVEVDEVGA